MMAESQREEEEGQKEAPGDRSLPPTDHSERTKPEPFHRSQGSVSSAPAVVERARTSHCDSLQESRQPEIPIVSTEPLSNNHWFPGPSVVFTPQSRWSASVQVVSQPPPSYDQVIQEKNQKEHITKPTAAPRRSTCTTTSATQTDQPCTAASPPALKKSASKKPQKPPRLSLSKAANRKPVIETVGEATANVSVVTDPEDQRGTKRDLEELEKADSSHTHRKSITVFWQIPKKHFPAATTETAASTSENRQRPIPRPRTKSQKQTTKAEIKVLPEASPSSDITQPDSLDVFTKKLSDELLEIFDEGHQFAERFDEQLGQTTQVGDALGEMSDPFSQRNIRSKIQAFEGQNGTEGGNESARPNPLARRATTKPPVAAKPSLPFRSMDDSQNIPAAPNPKPAPKAMPLRKPVGMSVREQLEALHSNGSIQQQPIYALPARASSHEEEPSPTPPVPPVKPFKQPLKPNLNINNHNSVSMSRESDLVDDNVHMKSQYNVDINGSFLPRQSTTRRPTTIRVPSKMPSISDNIQDDPPPALPFRKPIGSSNILQDYTKPAVSSQQCSMGPGPTLPPRKPSMNKPLPPRPPSGKVGPGRPPPPKFGATNRAPSISLQPPPKHQEINPNKTEMVLPPRPRPGHCLYNKYILELPHAIAALDYDGCNIGELSFEKDEVLLLLEKVNNNEYLCQAGEVIGRVHKSHLKIITPLESYSSPVYDDVPAASGGDLCGLTVKAIYDFQPQNPEELSLRAGDVVTGVEQADDQWYRGTCRGSTGFFPINYAEVLSNSPVPEKKEKPSLASISGPRCVARFDFEGEHSDELTFFEGDVIQLQKYVGEEWAQGQIGASIGIFPLNFVEVVEDLPPPPTQQLNQMFVPGISAAAAAAAAPPNIQAEPAKPAKTSKPNEWAVALHDYAAKTSSDLSFRQGDRILMTKHLDEKWSCGKLNGREGMFPRIYVQTVIEEQPTIDLRSKAAGGMRARALYDFRSDCDEELSIQFGDILTNVESVDEEWFLADLRGKRALVPKNYVQVLQ
ncbi:uncharacterized protein LOC144990266 isoform X3 [Oryzias latipes]